MVALRSISLLPIQSLFVGNATFNCKIGNKLVTLMLFSIAPVISCSYKHSATNFDSLDSQYCIKIMLSAIKPKIIAEFMMESNWDLNAATKKCNGYFPTAKNFPTIRTKNRAECFSFYWHASLTSRSYFPYMWNDTPTVLTYKLTLS